MSDDAVSTITTNEEPIDFTLPLAKHNIRVESYRGEQQLDAIRKLIDADLSEPYSVYTFRFFINDWPFLTFCVCVLFSNPPRYLNYILFFLKQFFFKKKSGF